MNILVFISGIADPKLPPPDLSLVQDGTGFPEEQPRILSPFDEAALEVALKLRDSDSQVRITLAVIAPGSSERLVRSVAAFRPDEMVHIDARGLPLWDVARSLATFEQVLSLSGRPADLVLIGREFGDVDEGSLPVALAEHLKRSYASLIQLISIEDKSFEMMRESAGVEQWLTLKSPAMASITNDRRNRLRQPLLKNVMSAKRAVIETRKPVIPSGAERVILRAAAHTAAPARATSCRMLDGPVENQIAELASVLDECKRAAHG